MLKMAICDDEEILRHQIYNIINKYLKDRKIECEIFLYDSGKELLNDLENGMQLSCLFLDVDLNESLNGVDIACEIRNLYKNTMMIVFVTSYSEYQSRVFSLRTFDYIIKPFKNSQFIKLLDDFFFWYNEEEKQHRIKFQFKTIDGLITIYKDELIYFEYYDRRINIVTKTKRYFMYDKMKNIYLMLKDYDFSVPHASFLINLNEVKAFLKSKNIVIMTDDKEIPISQLKTKEFRDKYLQFLKSKGNTYNDCFHNS